MCDLGSAQSQGVQVKCCWVLYPERDRDSLAGKGDEEGTEDILSLRESWPLQVVPGQGSR